MINRKRLSESEYEMIDKIHDSYINGQHRQMVEQIDESFIQYDFWELYYQYILQIHIKERSLEEYAETVIIYHRIKER
jgi:hypothetical protein